MDRGIPVFEIYNPEFLTERGAMHDFVNPQVQIFGGQALDRVETLYREHSICSPAPTVFRGTAIEASIIKYMINTFLAMKVEFFNEWAEVADKYGANFAKIANAVGGDPRIGMSHTKVPGPDGKLGFGGACFPKDLSAILYEDTLPLLAVTKYSNNQRRMTYERDSREIEQGIKFKS
jgi:UDPglucose 6-dehydrogenase